jgi:RiboL-PSP-HEPN
MPSKARETLAANKDDLERLWKLHEKEVGPTRGRKFNVDVLNRAAVVMVCAAWEAFCEDIVSEAIEIIVKDCKDPVLLPEFLRKFIARKVKDSKHDLAPWEMAGDGWRLVVKNGASEAVKKLTGSWNTPKTAQVNDLFSTSLGIQEISSTWKWQKNSVESTRVRLDEFVTLRGEIAHRLKPANSVHKKDGKEFYEFVSRVADIIETEVHSVIVAATTKKYW